MKKTELIEALERIRVKHMCAYVSIGRPNTFCDCKFSSNPRYFHGGPGSENDNGCPEMRTIINFIKELPDEEI